MNDIKLNSDFVKVYPNPATNRVRVVTSESSMVEVYNLSGQKIYKSHNSFKELEVNVRNWKPGMYVIRIKSLTKVWSHKLIVE